MHPYRTHNCGELRTEHEGKVVRLSGWVHRKRDHGNVLFIDLRDHYGLTQLILESNHKDFERLNHLRVESVITITGKVVLRTPETQNDNLPTGRIEVIIEDYIIQSEANALPFPVNLPEDYPEEMRLQYRYLDLRRERMHNNIMLRANVIASLRKQMQDLGFTEFQTPILTASSPEGARDYLVPSRVHPGHFYALPQAPQQFKQLLMMAGFDRYFQIAPCFRDEDGRADRSPGEFYQLDFEMSYVTQEDVFAALEPVLYNVFKDFGNKEVTPYPFERIPYDEAMRLYGSDKPDLRNPLTLVNVNEVFKDSSFSLFTNILNQSGQIIAIRAPQTAQKSRKFFDDLNEWARTQGMGGLGYIAWGEEGFKGPIAKFLDEDRTNLLKELTKCKKGDVVFFVAGDKKLVYKLGSLIRTKLGEDLDLIEQNIFKFCWIVDFPMYELNDQTSQIEFSHNPFSMPQGGLQALLTQDPLTLKAYQYDIVCNGTELSSGAIRNHLPEVMYKAFEIAGYGPEDVESKFGGLLNAFKFGAPPHGGCAPGVDRIVMLLADEPNIREVVAFPMNQQAQDLLMQAPAHIEPARLKELHIKLDLPPIKK
jgi:aspartyl-tRNA synthetase